MFPNEILRIIQLYDQKVFISQWLVDPRGQSEQEKYWKIRGGRCNVHPRGDIGYWLYLPLPFSGHYDFVVNWGDGTPKQHVTKHYDGKHKYTNIGKYTVSITGKINGFSCGEFIQNHIDFDILKEDGCSEFIMDSELISISGQRCRHLELDD